MLLPAEAMPDVIWFSTSSADLTHDVGAPMLMFQPFMDRSRKDDKTGDVSGAIQILKFILTWPAVPEKFRPLGPQ